VTLIYWLLGSARGNADAIAPLHGARLERLLQEIVDTPVRGFVYEATGSTPAEILAGGAASVCAANERWRIPVAIADGDPLEPDSWRARMLRHAAELTGTA
jgi:hypothetical protein